NRFDRVGRAPAHEYGQAPEEGLFVGVEQVVAPGDGSPEGALAGGQVLRAPGQQFQPGPRLRALQPPKDRLRWEEFDAGGGQLYGEGQPVQPAADLRHGRRAFRVKSEIGPDGQGALNEQLYRLVFTKVQSPKSRFQGLILLTLDF